MVVVFSAETACNAAAVSPTVLEKEAMNDQIMKAPEVIEAPPLYSFSLKRSNSNCVDDGSNRKKVIKSVVTNENNAPGRNSKLPAAASKKPGSRRLDSRKGDIEPKIIEVPTGKEQSVVTRSRLRKD